MTREDLAVEDAFKQLLQPLRADKEKDNVPKIEALIRLKDQMDFGVPGLRERPKQLKRQHHNFPSGNARLGDSVIVIPPQSEENRGRGRPAPVFGKVVSVGSTNSAGYDLDVIVETDQGERYKGFPRGTTHGKPTEPVIVVQPLQDELELFDWDGELRATAEKYNLLIVRHPTNRDDPEYTLMKLTDDGVLYSIALKSESVEYADLRYADGSFYNGKWSLEGGDTCLNIPGEADEDIPLDEAIPGFEAEF